jgi:hypothetical protein
LIFHLEKYGYFLRNSRHIADLEEHIWFAINEHGSNAGQGVSRVFFPKPHGTFHDWGPNLPDTEGLSGNSEGKSSLRQTGDHLEELSMEF